MKKRFLAVAVAGAFATPFAASQAGTVTTLTLPDIKVSGGITAAYVHTSENLATNPGIRSNQDAFEVNDALIDLKADAKTGGVGFDLGIGALAGSSLAHRQELNPIGNLSTGGVSSAEGGVAVQYGYVTVVPVDGLKLDAGLVPTNIGSEVAPSYANANILRGLIWSAQPVYYTAARATYSVGGLNLYAEANKHAFSPFTGTAAGNTGDAFGVSGSFAHVNVAYTYFNLSNQGTMHDLLANTTVGSLQLGGEFHYMTKDDATKTPNTDDNAWALGLYATFPLADKFTLPARLEYVNDGTSGLYGLGGAGVDNKAWTLTVTPTYNFTDATFLRAEVAYVKTDKKGPYVDSDGNTKDNALTIGAQAGVRF
jgi:hypothetical protein